LYQAELQSVAGGSAALPRVRSAGAPALLRRARDGIADLHYQQQRLIGDAVALLRAARAGELDPAHLDLDLGIGLFTRAWWLKAGACAALVGAAVWAGSNVAPIHDAAPPAFTPSQREDAAVFAIAPLARGGVTGAAPRVDARQLRPLAEAPERPRVERSLTIGRRGLAAALRNAGVGSDDVAAVTRLLAGINPGGGVRAELVLGRRENKSLPRPLDQLGVRAAFDLKVELRRVDGALSMKRIPIAVDSSPLRVDGAAGGNLNRALRSAGVPAGPAAEFVRQMRHVVDFQRGLGKADRFDIIVEQDRAATGEVRHGKLLFGALTRKGKTPVEIGLYKGDYYQASGEGVRRGLMRTPVDGARMTSGFGMRLHPLLGFSRMHQGVDFGAGSGTPIIAAGGGTVSFAGWHGGHGRYVMIRHNKELASAYAHMSRIAVKPGQKVRQGQVIGNVGSTGMSTGPHLHYEVWLRGRPANPVSLRFIGGQELAGRDLNLFQRQMNRWRTLPESRNQPVNAD
jgi:murein DD-endopeptidase MepM/ murein hydrolase activator NlpD